LHVSSNGRWWLIQFVFGTVCLACIYLLMLNHPTLCSGAAEGKRGTGGGKRCDSWRVKRYCWRSKYFHSTEEEAAQVSNLGVFVMCGVGRGLNCGVI
jgi:hypothetical protein